MTGITTRFAQAAESKPVVRGQLGISIEALTPALKQVYHAKSGVFVNEVQPDGPASKAGV